MITLGARSILNFLERDISSFWLHCFGHFFSTGGSVGPSVLESLSVTFDKLSQCEIPCPSIKLSLLLTLPEALIPSERSFLSLSPTSEAQISDRHSVSVTSLSIDSCISLKYNYWTFQKYCIFLNKYKVVYK